MPINYAVIINSYGRQSQWVERAAQAALTQKIAPQKVILVDQNNTPLQLKNEIETHPLFSHQYLKNKSVSQARNSVSVESYDWIIFCDDDGFMAPEYSENFIRVLEKSPAVELIAGSIVIENTDEYYSIRHKIGGDINHFWNTKLLMGSNFAIRSQTFADLKKFDPDFGIGSLWNSSEETDLSWKAYFNKKLIRFAPELVVYHVKPYSGPFLPSVKKAFIYGGGKGALVAKWISSGYLLVFLELAEMILVPILNSLIALLTLKPHLTLIYMAAFIGRIWGFIAWFFPQKKN